jgi:hypothetical protein
MRRDRGDLFRFITRRDVPCTSAALYDLAGAPEPTSTALGSGGPVLQLSLADKLKRLDEIFPGVGANVTNTSRFTSWERWGYDWHMDVEPALMDIAQRNGPEWLPRTLVYFDDPIKDMQRARLEGRSRGRRGGEKRLEDYTEDELDKLLADAAAADDAARAKSMAEG